MIKPIIFLRSDVITKIQICEIVGSAGALKKNKMKKIPFAKNQPLGDNNYKHCYAPMTQALWKREA